MEPQYDPQPISLEDAKRIWTLQKQKAPLAPDDQKLLQQAMDWQMWVSHGLKVQIRSRDGKKESPVSSRRSGSSRRAAAVR
jgi:hypothetical protein